MRHGRRSWERIKWYIPGARVAAISAKDTDRNPRVPARPSPGPGPRHAKFTRSRSFSPVSSLSSSSPLPLLLSRRSSSGTTFLPPLLGQPSLIGVDRNAKAAGWTRGPTPNGPKSPAKSLGQRRAENSRIVFGRSNPRRNSATSLRRRAPRPHSSRPGRRSDRSAADTWLRISFRCSGCLAGYLRAVNCQQREDRFASSRLCSPHPGPSRPVPSVPSSPVSSRLVLPSAEAIIKRTRPAAAGLEFRGNAGWMTAARRLCQG